MALIFGGTFTVIANVHESVRCWLSVAVQVTVLGPGGNVDPLAGVHAVATGGTPLTIVGVAYTTEIGWAEWRQERHRRRARDLRRIRYRRWTGVGCVGGDAAAALDGQGAHQYA